MNDEVKLILTKLKIVSEEKENGAYICDKEHSKLLLSYIEQLEQKCESLLENKNETLRYISNYLTLDQRFKWNDNVDEKLKLVKNFLNGREKTKTNISYEDLEKENKQLKKQKDDVVEGLKDLRQFVYDELVDFNVRGATETYCKIKDLLRMLGEIDENNR